MDHVGHQICRLVLERYGTLANIGHSDKSGIYATHYAAGWANRVALDLIQSHLTSYMRKHPTQRQVSFGVIVNLKDSQGGTALDYTVNNFIDPDNFTDLDGHTEKSHLFLNARLRADRRPAAKECYKALRESGAMHEIELSGLRLA